jgi:DNA-directed RNA polymerase subunit M/transcription elongation factor TFIIS
MILKLKSPQAQFPNAGWPFKDPRTGFTVKGVAAYEQTAHGLAHKIIKNRRANPHLYSASEPQWFDTESVVQEIYQLKKSTHPELFTDSTASLPAPTADKKVTTPQGLKCPECGSADVTALGCKTCSGNRIKSYKCNACNKGWK